MRRFLLCLLLILCLLCSVGFDRSGKTITLRKNASHSVKVQKDKIITPMVALDLVKAKYAANFEKVIVENTKEYYYKLPDADYYLLYEGTVKDERNYLFHLYEFVVDDPDANIGHTVTYGWYIVDKNTGLIQDNSP